jgi:hypothetical protein
MYWSSFFFLLLIGGEYRNGKLALLFALSLAKDPETSIFNLLAELIYLLWKRHEKLSLGSNWEKGFESLHFRQESINSVRRLSLVEHFYRSFKRFNWSSSI